MNNSHIVIYTLKRVLRSNRKHRLEGLQSRKLVQFKDKMTKELETINCEDICVFFLNETNEQKCTTNTPLQNKNKPKHHNTSMAQNILKQNIFCF